MNEFLQYTIPGLAAGSYTAVASLLSENHPKEQRVGFSLPGKAVSVR